MEWARESSQWSLIVKIDIDKAYDWVGWSFILEILIFLTYGLCCVAMVKTLFTNALAFVLVKNASSLCICYIVPFLRDSPWLLIYMC